jgi:hypothetical protein
MQMRKVPLICGVDMNIAYADMRLRGYALADMRRIGSAADIAHALKLMLEVCKQLQHGDKRDE